MMYLSRIDQTHASEWFSSHERFELEKKKFHAKISGRYIIISWETLSL